MCAKPWNDAAGVPALGAQRNAQLMILSIAHLPNRRHARYFFLQKKQTTSRETAEAGMVVVTRGKGGLGGGHRSLLCDLPELHCWTYIHAYQSRRSILASRVHTLMPISTAS